MRISFMLLLQTQIQIRVNFSFVQFVPFRSARAKTLPTLLEVYFLTSTRRSASDPQIRRCSRRSVQFVYSLFLSLFLSCYFTLFTFFPISFYLGCISFLSIQPKKKPPFGGLVLWHLATHKDCQGQYSKQDHIANTSVIALRTLVGKALSASERKRFSSLEVCFVSLVIRS